jgi:dihydroorotate dehydrogenase electron transfer subunit
MTHYAEALVTEICEIVEHVQIAEATFRLRIHHPELAARTLPGQFLMIRIAGCNDPLIGRALAMFDRSLIAGQPAEVDVVYVVKGKFTQMLCRLEVGQSVEVWGPLGNTFSTDPVDHLILVAGGVGQTPMLTVAKEALGIESFGDSSSERPNGFAQRVSLCYGARHASLLAGVDLFEQTCTEVMITTDDGSAGTKGLVTDSLIELLANRRESETTRVACCGPEPMMQAVAKVAADHSVDCQVSLETPMACGIGICFTCVAKVRDETGSTEWDYQRTCVDGPVFDATKLVW